MDLHGKAALVTGGAARLGRAIALALARRGAHVAITYLTSRQAAAKTLAEIEACGVRGLAVACDQRREEQVALAVGATVAALGSLDVLVNNAAVFHRTPLESLDRATWDREIEVNLRGPFLFALHAAAALRCGQGGKIVNLADVAGFRPWKSYLPYSVSKAGVIALTKALASELAPEVQVNAVAPGAALWPEDYSDEQKAAVLARIPLGRAGSAEDVVATVLFLLQGSDYLTGAVIPVDGGRSLT